MSTAQADIEGLQEKLIESFKRQMTLAANLKKAKQLTVRDNTLYMMFDNSFAANTVREASPQIIKKIEELTGNKYGLRVSVENEKKAKAPVPEDERVELVKRVFRGEIVEEE
jgi:chromosomal replication initiation ATPase DnaA